MRTLASVLLTCVAVSAQDLVLTSTRAVELAMQHNESIAMARADADAASAFVGESRADGLPDVDAQFDYTRNWLLSTFFFNDTAVKIGRDNQMAGRLQLTQPLYTGGSVSGSVQSARQRVIVAEQDERLLRQLVTAQVETAIYEYLLAVELAGVRQSALLRARSNQQQVDALRAAGRATRFEETRAEVLVATAQSDSIEAAHEVARSAILLRDVVGLDWDQPLQVDARFRDTSQWHSASSTVGDLVQLAHEHRPEQRRLQALMQGFLGDEKAAQAGTRPRLDLIAIGQMQYEDDTFSNATETDEWRRSWSTGLSLQVPLFDGLRTRSRVAQVRHSRRRVQLEVERLERTIESDVRQAAMDVTATIERLRAREGLVQQATAGLQDAEARYRAGAGTQLEVLDAQLSLRLAESEAATALRDRAVALVDLERAVGVLGEDGPD